MTEENAIMITNVTAYGTTLHRPAARRAPFEDAARRPLMLAAYSRSALIPNHAVRIARKTHATMTEVLTKRFSKFFRNANRARDEPAKLIIVRSSE